MRKRTVRVYNTLTRRKEEFEPLEPGKVRMYNCGPTVYWYATVGNFRAFIFADVLRRYLEYQGYEVTQIMNITDVGHLTEDAEDGEDKLEKSAREQKKDPWQIAGFYEKAFFEDIDALRIQRARAYPRATAHVGEMIALVQRLLERGYAYEKNACVYYDISKFPDYGRLSGNPLEDLIPGARLEINPDKKDPRDFALWVTDPKHIMKWDSPWGVGYPYWHVECSAMAMKYLGDTVDIHTGGEDNIFPHHECEIAQSEGATGKPYVRYWMHTRFLLVDGQKMSKSLGNFYTLRDLVDKGYDPIAIRHLLVSTQYRQPLNFTLDGIDAARRTIQRLLDFRARLSEAHAPEDNPDVPAILEKAREGFEAGMDDDLNVSVAIAAVFDMMHELNKLMLSQADAAKTRALLDRFDTVLGVLGQEEKPVSAEHEKRITALLAEREQARKRRDFTRADAIRDQLREEGIVIEDRPEGPRWKRG